MPAGSPNVYLIGVLMDRIGESAALASGKLASQLAASAQRIVRRQRRGGRTSANEFCQLLAEGGRLGTPRRTLRRTWLMCIIVLALPALTQFMWAVVGFVLAMTARALAQNL